MLRAGMPVWTLRVLFDAERHERHSHAGACGTSVVLEPLSCPCSAWACLSGRSAPSCDAERHERHSHAGACGTSGVLETLSCPCSAWACLSGRSASSLTQSVTNGIPTLERVERAASLKHYRAHAPRGHACLDAPRPLATQSVMNGISDGTCGTVDSGGMPKRAISVGQSLPRAFRPD
ncbi:hypothetical protein K0038_00432 [Pseudomonas syringae]|nr:hypothetical protein [Pseudomonas syringae]